MNLRLEIYKFYDICDFLITKFSIGCTSKRIRDKLQVH